MTDGGRRLQYPRRFFKKSVGIKIAGNNNPSPVMKQCISKCRLQNSSAAFSCKHHRLTSAYRQIVWIQIRLLILNAPLNCSILIWVHTVG